MIVIKKQRETKVKQDLYCAPLLIAIKNLQKRAI